jgi:hypothetical protein
MGAAGPQPLFDELPRCARCGEVIGVYERLVEVVAGRARRTSRAADPLACRTGEACFHARCYQHPAVDGVD